MPHPRHRKRPSGEMEAIAVEPDSSEAENLFDEEDMAVHGGTGKLDLDFGEGDFGKAEEDEPSGAGDSEELELDLDLGEADLEITGEDEAPAAGDSEEIELDLDLGEADLEITGEDEAPAAGDSEEIELDLDLDFEGDDGVVAEAPSDGDSEEIELDLDLGEGDFEVAGEEEAPAAGDSEELELDLDLDFEGDDGVVAEAPSDGDSEELELDLDLDFEGDDGVVAEAPAAGDSEEIELDLDLDLDDDKDISQEQEFDLDLDLDLGGVDELEIAEPDIDLGDAKHETDEFDLDLDLDLEGEDSLQIAEPELDLSSEEPEKDEFDLDLEMEDGAVEEAAAETDDLELDFDVVEEPTLEADADAEDGAAEFELTYDEDDLDQADAPMKKEGVLLTQDDAGIDAAFDMAASEKGRELEPDEDETDFEEAFQAEPAAKKEAKKRFSPVILILVLVLAVGGAGAGLTLLGGKKIGLPVIGEVTVPSIPDLNLDALRKIDIPFLEKIPFIGDRFKPKADEMGSLKINIYDPMGKFVINSKSGRLFLIKGSAKNEYQHARAFIIVTGKLYTKGKKLAKTEIVFCGNILPDIDLENLEYEQIRKRLKNRGGNNKSNENIKPGASIPFMIVFSDLPDNLEEYTIEVKGSSPVK